MKILLTGANGFIGRHINTALVMHGHHVISASRHNGIDFNRMFSTKAWLAVLQDIDIVINAVGIIAETRQQSFESIHHLAPAALFRACEQQRVKKVIQLSALGVEHLSTPYQCSKKAADDVLKSLNIAWFILRPSLVYGEGGKSLKLFKRMANLPVIPVISGGQQLIQPIHISDLVATVLQCLTTTQAKRLINVVGAKAVSMQEWLCAIRNSQGKKIAPIISMPYGLSVASSHLLRFINPVMHPDNLKMLQQGNTADVQALVDFLGHSPLSIKEGLCYI